MKSGDVLTRREETAAASSEVRVLPIDGQLDLPAIRDGNPEEHTVIRMAGDRDILIEQVGLVGEERSAVSIAHERRQLEHVVVVVVTTRRAAVAPVGILSKQ